MSDVGERVHTIVFERIPGAPSATFLAKSRAQERWKDGDVFEIRHDGTNLVTIVPDAPTDEHLRLASFSLISYALAHKFRSLTLDISSFPDRVVPVIEGIRFASYSFHRKSSPPSSSLEVGVIPPSSDTRLITKLHITFDVVAEVRDLVNMPANECTIEAFSTTVKTWCEKLPHTSLTILNETDLRAMGMHAILAVGKGSTQKPLLLIVEYAPPGTSIQTPDVVLLGKGVLFDSGGLCLKSAEAMETMKEDMAGAAAVVGALKAAVLNGLSKAVVVVTPLVENMPDGGATRPGDIVRAFNGKTIEIINTDAEGRLILADALSYVYRTYTPRAVVDVATLTGACDVALGPLAAAVLGTDSSLISQLIDAGERTGERLWQLPLWEEHREWVKSKIADVKNIGLKGKGGVIAGAAFLREFIDEKKCATWAHLDIASTAFYTAPTKYYAEGATGFGVRLLSSWLLRL